jgi:hypothetical protein
MPEIELKTPEQALKAIHDLRVDNERQGLSIQQITTRLDDIEKTMRVAFEAQGQHRDALDSSERELVSRYTARDKDGKDKVLLRGVESEGGIYTPGLLDDVPHNEIQAELQRAVDNRVVVNRILGGIARFNGRELGRKATPALDQQIQRLARGLPHALREAFERAWADTSGYGADFIPDEMLPTFERDIVLEWEHRVPGLFQEIPRMTPAQWGFLSKGWQAYLQGDVSGDDPGMIKSSSGTTTVGTADFITLAVRAQVSEDATEDSLLPVMDLVIRPGLTLAIVAGMEDAILNGDTTATHADTGIASWNPDSFWPAAPGGLSVDHRRAWIGLRHRAGDVSNTVDRSTFSIAAFILDCANLDGPMARPEDTVAIFSKLGLAKNVFADTTSTLTAGIRTLDQYAGNGGPIVPGEICRIAGVPVLVSQFMTADLNASGIYDASVTTYTGACVVRRNRFKMFTRRGLRLETQKDITRGVWNLVATTRRNFRNIGASTEKNVRYLYQMAKS